MHRLSPHRRIVDAPAHSGHILRDTNTIQFDFELPAGVLESAVTVENRFSVSPQGLIECLEYQCIVVGTVKDIGKDRTVMEVADWTQYALESTPYLNSVTPVTHF